MNDTIEVEVKEIPDNEPEQSLAIVNTPVDLVPQLAITVEEYVERMNQVRQFIKASMVEDIDFGLIPGTKKKNLLKPGAEKLNKMFAFVPQYEVVNKVEDWDKPLFHYQFD